MAAALEQIRLLRLRCVFAEVEQYLVLERRSERLGVIEGFRRDKKRAEKLILVDLAFVKQ